MGVEDKHLLFPMPLQNSKFDSIYTGRADPSRYLIIGFDTEYQRYANDDTRVGYRHLQFQSEPWETTEQFQKTRQLWEQYNLSERHCLKTVEDLDAFASFHESSLSTEGDASKYLRKDQGDLKRLRQELLIAWKLAGLLLCSASSQRYNRSANGTTLIGH